MAKLHKQRLSLFSFGLVAFCLLLADSALAKKENHRCVNDISDRKVCVNSRHPTIISLSPGSTELLFAAGAGKQVIAVDQHSNYPEDVNQLPTVGGFPTVNVEAIVGMKPDLVVVWSGGDSPKVIKQLESLGINTFYLDAVDFPGIEQAIMRLGQIAGTEKAADDAVNRFYAHLTRLSQQYSELEPVSVFFEIWRSPLKTVGNGILINDVIALCGGFNVYSDLDQRVPKIGVESLVARNPQVIVGSDQMGNSLENLKDMQAFWGQWAELEAVKKNQFYVLPADLISRTSPRILEGAEILCQQLQEVRQKTTVAIAYQKSPKND